MAFGKKDKKNNKISFEKSQVAERHNIRISSPNGYYPEDVDRVLLSLEDQITQLTRDNEKLIQAAELARNDLSKLQVEFQRYRLQMTSFSLPEETHDQDIKNISKIQNITQQEIEPTVEISEKDGDLDVLGLVDTESNTHNSAIMDTGELDLLGL